MIGSEIVQKEFESIQVDLIQRYDELNMRASGQFEREAETVVDSDDRKINAKIEGVKYTQQLVFGRANGRFPPIQAIEQWIDDKGIQPVEQNMKTSTLAFLIARKIAREGTKYFRQGGTDLIESVVTPQRLDKIINQVGVINVNSTVTTLTDILKRAAT